MTTAETSPHRLRKRERMIQRILETARQIMREEGVAALSIQELARRLDLRAPSLYNYFHGKMDLYDALFRLGIQRFSEHLESYGEPAASWQAEIQRIAEAYLSFAIQNPELYQLCFERHVPGFVPSDESLALSFGMLQQGYDRAASWIPQVQSGVDPQRGADLLIAMIHGLTAQHLANQPELPLGQGRFGSLIPDLVQLLNQAWSR